MQLSGASNDDFGAGGGINKGCNTFFSKDEIASPIAKDAALD
jgi:hypothetical protein